MHQRLFPDAKDPLPEAELESEQTQAELPPLTEPEPRQSRRRTVGQLLRETREGQGSDLNRVATALRIRAAYLEAIEEGRYDNLPGAVYALGFVRTYAVHLGLDGEEAVRRFKLEAEGFDGQRDLTFPVPLGERSIPRATLVLFAVILAICGYVIFNYLSSSARPRPEHVSAVPAELVPPHAVVAAPPPPAATSETSSSDSAATASPPGAPLAGALSPPPAGALSPPPMTQTAPVETPAPTATTSASGSLTADAPPPVTVAPAPAPAAAPAPAPAPAPVAALTVESAAPPLPEKAHVYGLANGRTRIVIHAIADSWIQVRDQDNVAIFTRKLHAGDFYHVPDGPGLSMRTGLASGLAVTVDGRSVPPLSGGTRSNILLEPDRLLAGTAMVRPGAVHAPASSPAAAPVTDPAPASTPVPTEDPAAEPVPDQLQ